MSEYLAISEVKDLLAECPICSEHFDDDSRIPRRMPCCVQSICQPCLETYSKGRQTLSCPLCRHQHYLPGGIKSLPKEVIILRMLEHLKIQKGLKLPCTDCPDNETASARCEDCGAYLCHECKRAHSRHVSSRHHKIIALEEMTDRPVESFRRHHQCKDHNQPLQFYCHTCEKVVCVGCTVVEHREGKGHDVVSIDEAHAKKTEATKKLVDQLEKKTFQLRQNVQNLTKTTDDITASTDAAKQVINKSFDILIAAMQKHRRHLLSDLESERIKHIHEDEANLEKNNALLARIASTTDYIKAVMLKANKTEELQLMSTSSSALRDIVKETDPKEKPVIREGIMFVPIRLHPLRLIHQAAGLHYLHKLPDDYILVVRGKGSHSILECPDLEFDTSTAADSLSVTSARIVTNTKPTVPLQDKRCQFKVSSDVLASRSLVITKDTFLLFGMKVQFTTNKRIPKMYSVFEMGLESQPADSDVIDESSEILVMLQECSRHSSLCLCVCKRGLRYAIHTPFVNNMAGVSGSLNIWFLLDGRKNMLHLVNEGNGKEVKSMTLEDDVFDKPLCMRVHLEDRTKLSLEAEICSGMKHAFTSEMKHIISGLILPAE